MLQYCHMDRQLVPLILRDLPKKIVLLSGPRQSGKTWLSRNLGLAAEYLNYDDADHRRIIRERSWDRRKALVVLDELHKMPTWKSWLKGVFDVEGIPPALLVTGSARLDIHRRMGDSLAGRFFQYRLHPFDVRELAGQMEPRAVLERILQVGGFPEPFLEADPNYYKRWKKTHLDVILRQDLLDLVTVSDLRSFELLVDLLRSRVGSPISYASLARDLERDAKTVKRWLQILEELFVIFPVRPWHRNVARSILKEPKFYFYDTGQVTDSPGPRLENAVAGSLLKTLQFFEDRDGRNCSLYYLRTRDGQEVDFALACEDRVTHLVEVKVADENLSPAFRLLGPFFPDAERVQLALNPKRAKSWPTGESLRPAAEWLAELSL
jgi:predicted AAA+ superfamily ATPase